jgi:hypothetical protein
MSDKDEDWQFQAARLESDRNEWKQAAQKQAAAARTIARERDKWRRLALLHEANAGSPALCAVLREGVGLPPIGPASESDRESDDKDNQ